MKHEQQQSNHDGSITYLLGEINAGKNEVRQQLFSHIYEELRLIAQSRIRSERKTPADGEVSDLVNDAYLRLREKSFRNRKHLFACYALVMRNILTDRNRRNMSLRRGGRLPHFSIEDSSIPDLSSNTTINHLEEIELFDKLKSTNSEAAEVFELRLFGGIALRDISEILGQTENDTRRLWNEALSLMKEWSDDTV